MRDENGEKIQLYRLGMIFVMSIGSGIGITAFTITKNALFFTVP